MSDPTLSASTAGVISAADTSSLAPDVEDKLKRFIERSAFGAQGGVVTDLDGTVVFESQGTTLLSPAVEHALKALYELGRPLMLNSLRFPLSVMRTFGAEWYRLSNAPIPTVSLNGSQMGYIHQAEGGELRFEELAAFPLDGGEIDGVLRQVQSLLDGGVGDVLLFYYPRDWRLGEIVWAPAEERVAPARAKYRSASSVGSSGIGELRARLSEQEICMIFLLVEAPEDTLMAYQHTKRANFFTHAGVDKLSGTRELARRLGVDLAHSLGAGDTEMDRFLAGVGLALHVGPQTLDFRGTVETIRVPDAAGLADLLFRFATLERERGARSHHAVVPDAVVPDAVVPDAAQPAPDP